MPIAFIKVERAFRHAIPGDAMPQAALDRIKKIKEEFRAEGAPQDLLDRISEDDVFTAARELIEIWEEEWDAHHSEDVTIMQRYEQMDEDYSSTVETEKDLPQTKEAALHEINRVDALIEQEESGLVEAYNRLALEKDVSIAKRMRSFLLENELVVPPEITMFLNEFENRTDNAKERR